MLKNLKKLAKSNKWQMTYNNAKELSNFRLFNNDSDLSYIQYMFLYWLSVYASLYQDLMMGEDYLTEEIIDDELRAEAYLLLRQLKRKEKKDPKKKKKEINPTRGMESIIFKRK